jgi:hypothetical protein
MAWWLEPQSQQKTPDLGETAAEAGLLLNGLLGLSQGTRRVPAEVFLQAGPVVFELAAASFPRETTDGVQAALGELLEVSGDRGAGDASQAGDVVMRQALVLEPEDCHLALHDGFGMVVAFEGHGNLIISAEGDTQHGKAPA